MFENVVGGSDWDGATWVVSRAIEVARASGGMLQIVTATRAAPWRMSFGELSKAVVDRAACAVVVVEEFARGEPLA